MLPPLVQSFNDEFAKLSSLWRSLIEKCASENIYEEPQALSLPSIGESILRSAAVVEQMFGGLTSNLWDDPFEWTLPETLTTREKILEYLSEVDDTRGRAFASFASDTELTKNIAAPSGEVQTVATLLLRTFARASEYYGQAILTAKILSGRNTSRFIISECSSKI
jgi:hypothetical protein